MTRSFTLLLASRSPRRRQWIRRLGVPVRFCHSTYRESRAHAKGQKPAVVVRTHALGKALGAVLPTNRKENFLVLGADTIVLHKGKILGKPSSKKEAVSMLQSLSGRTHQVLSAVALWAPGTGRRMCRIARTTVTFKRLDKPAILRYLDAVNPLDKAGAYAIQEGPRIVQSIRGSRSNVIGLPLELLRKMLQRAKRWYR